MVRSKVRALFGNAPVKLVAVLLFAILIPSVLVTALGLVAVFQADAFVQGHRRRVLETQLDGLVETLGRRWAERLDVYREFLRDADQRLAQLDSLRRRDPLLLDILVSDATGLRRIPPPAPRELWSPVRPPELASLDSQEARGGSSAGAFREAERLMAESQDPLVVLEASLAAARLSYRRGRRAAAAQYWEEAVRDYGDTKDETGVVRGVPILARLVDVYEELDRTSEFEDALSRLRRALETYADDLSPSAREYFSARLARWAVSPDGTDRTPAATRSSGGGRGGLRDEQLAEFGVQLPDPATFVAPEIPQRNAVTSAGMGYDCVSFLADRGTLVVHLVLDRAGYSIEVERTAEGLGLVGTGLRLSARDRSAPQEKPFFDRLRPKDTFARPLPLPLDSLQLIYVPSPGQLPPRFQGFEIMSLTTFTWSVVVLVLTLVVGVIFILRSVLHERRTARLKTDFVSFISHELKTPLTSIRLYTETLLDGRVANQEEQTLCLQMVDKESLRLSQLIDQILRYSQLERHQKQFFFTSCSMRDVVGEAVRVFKGYKEGSDREVEVNSAQLISKIRMDRAAIIELLLNFLTNAAKYSPPDKNIVINLRESIDEICVDVVDRGVGIRKRDQKKVFEKFYRSEDYLTRDVEGTGLGLTFARYIAKVHNGEIKVSSQLNGGSTFTLHLRKTQVLAE